MPSTMRKRFASENDISGMNTAHARCTQPWPSVGLQTRKNESAGGCNAFLSRSRLGRAQRTQSGFCESHWSYKTALGTRRGRTSETSAVFSFWQRSHIQASTEPGSTIPHAPEYATRRICISEGRRFYFYMLGQSSPEWTRVWHSLHLKTLPEPYL
jgi:hypothetical protein